MDLCLLMFVWEKKERRDGKQEGERERERLATEKNYLPGLAASP